MGETPPRGGDNGAHSDSAARHLAPPAVRSGERGQRGWGGQPAQGVTPSLQGAKPVGLWATPHQNEPRTRSGSVPRHGGEEELGVSSLDTEIHRVPRGTAPPPPHVTRAIPAGLWMAEGVDDKLAPPESQWLVYALGHGKACKTGGEVTKQEETRWPGRRGAVLPNCV